MATSTLTTSPRSRIAIPAGSWKVDQAHSRVGFAVKSLGISTVRGQFSHFDGALEIGHNPGDSRAYGRVNAASVDTNQPRRDKHLRSTDFLSAERHPELTFRSKAIEPVDRHSFRVIGDLSINGVTNQVELTAKPGRIETGSEGEERLRLEVTGEVSRRAFAMTFLAGLGSAVVADKVKIVIDLAANKEV